MRWYIHQKPTWKIISIICSSILLFLSKFKNTKIYENVLNLMNATFTWKVVKILQPKLPEYFQRFTVCSKMVKHTLKNLQQMLQDF